MKRILVLLALISVLAIPTAVSATDSHAGNTASKKVISAICPVQKERIKDISKAAGKSVYKGKTYYFCCSGCKTLFDKNPGKYIVSAKSAKQLGKKAVSAACSVCGHKTTSASKASAKSVYKGKTYYFCCSGCKHQFDKNPAKYIDKKK